MSFMWSSCSLGGVTQNVKETKGSVKNVGKKVVGNKAAVDSLTTKVKKQEKNVVNLEGGLDTVTQRVDLAEKDIKETKNEVEEMDEKVCVL